MTFVEIIETSPEAKRGRPVFLTILWLAYAGFLLFTAARLAGWPSDALRAKMVDFHDFYLAGVLVNDGRVQSAYAFQDLINQQRTLFGEISLMPWTYPPQFDLLMGPLARLPLGLAYVLFVGATLGAYLLMLRRLAPGRAASVFMLMAPSIVMTIGCGQNGFLTGALIGAAAIGLIEGRAWAGVPLGLMIIKPHLAVAIALHTLLARRWNVVLVAGLTVAMTSALATAVFGFGVWFAFLGAVKAAGHYLSIGLYPEYRMISGYAMAHSLGLSPSAATGVQLAFVTSAILATAVAVTRFNQRQAIGIAAIASVMISPYAYDYDMPVLGVGVAILLGDLSRYGTLAERLSLYVFVFGVQVMAYASAVRVVWQPADMPQPASVGCLSVVATLAMAWRILERARAPELATIEASRRDMSGAERPVAETCAV